MNSSMNPIDIPKIPKKTPIPGADPDEFSHHPKHKTTSISREPKIPTPNSRSLPLKKKKKKKPVAPLPNSCKKDVDKTKVTFTASTAPKKSEQRVGRQTKIQQNIKEQEVLAHSQIHQLVYYLLRKTHFDTEQIKALIEMHRRLSSMGKIDRLRFRETLHNMLGLTDSAMLDRTFEAFDGDKGGSVTASEWIIGLSVILRGSLDEQINYCYQVFDTNGDQSIGRQELASTLQGCLYNVPGQENDFDLDEGCREMVELTMRKLDVDHDGQISFPDFYEAVHNDPLLLQAIGECLPTDKSMMTFLSLIDTRTRKYSCFLSHPMDPAWECECNKFDPEVIEYNKYRCGIHRSERDTVHRSVFRKSTDDKDGFNPLEPLSKPISHSNEIQIYNFNGLLRASFASLPIPSNVTYLHRSNHSPPNSAKPSIVGII